MKSSRLLPVLAIVGIVSACSDPPPPDLIPDPTYIPDVPQREIRRPRVHVETEIRTPTPGRRTPVRPPAVAMAAGWMPLRMTGVERFRSRHRGADGRGVLIGILDSGVDPDAPGLQETTTGMPKILDIRDFSSEGVIPLEPVTDPRGDSVQIGGVGHAGVGRIRNHALQDQTWYVGSVFEGALGPVYAADLNADGDAADTFGVVVVRTSQGLAAIFDTDGDRSFGNEQPVQDFLFRREVVRFEPDAPDSLRRTGVAVNLTEEDGRPVLALVADTDGHGTHVAGIAAANGLGGVEGFEGVAPGAQLLALKITDNGRGGMTATGSIVAAMQYAVKRARERRLPLVLNLSYGVGNEHEGRAVIDSLIDAFLIEHPQVVFVVSGGNDGPGLSTIGSPGSAQLAITVGAVFPRTFVANRAVDAVASFSARGGELAKPDLVAPGVAYSSVAAWDVGQEIKGGTSMAAPHVAGVVARLISGALQEGHPWTAASVGAALKRSANPVFRGTALDQGFGVPDIEQAWRLIVREETVPRIIVRSEELDGATVNGIILRAVVPGVERVVGFTLESVDARGETSLRLKGDAKWLSHPDRVIVGRASGRLRVGIVPGELPDRPMATATLTAVTDRGGSLPVFRIVVTVQRPHALREGPLVERRLHVPAGTVVRRFVRVPDGAGGLDVRVTMVDPRAGADLFLFEPSGQPLHGRASGHAAVGGQVGQARTLRVRGDDLGGGVFEIAVASTQRAHAMVDLDVRLPEVSSRAAVLGDTVWVVPGHLISEVTAIGAQYEARVRGNGASEVRLAIRVPEWAATLEIDFRMPRAQWERFTDFRLALTSDDRSPLGARNLDYAHSRLTIPVDPQQHGSDLWLDVVPAAALPSEARTWEGEVVVKALAADAMPLDPHASVSGAFMYDDVWPLPDAWSPLVQVVVRSPTGVPSVQWMPLRSADRPLGLEHIRPQ